MTTLQQLADSLTSSIEVYEDTQYGEGRAFFESLGIPIYGYEEISVPLLATQAVSTWMCTDTLVGLWLIRYDGQPVGLMTQPYRKSTPEFHWESTEVRDKIRAYVIQCWLSAPGELPTIDSFSADAFIQWAVSKDSYHRPHHKDHVNDCFEIPA